MFEDDDFFPEVGVEMDVSIRVIYYLLKFSLMPIKSNLGYKSKVLKQKRVIWAWGSFPNCHSIVYERYFSN